MRSTRANRTGKAKFTNVVKIILTVILAIAIIERNIAAAKRRRRRCVLPEYRLAAADTRRSIRVAVAEVTKSRNRADAAAAVTPADVVAAVRAETS